MKALENDLIVFIQLVDAIQKYAETIQDEAKRRELFNVSNRVNRVVGACSSFIINFKTSLHRDDAQALQTILNEEHALDSLNVLLFSMSLAPCERQKLLEIFAAINQGKTITIND
jgi:hypothetical protein